MVKFIITQVAKVGLGGVFIMDHCGVVVFVFSFDIGVCFIAHSELWAIYISISVVWTHGFKSFVV